MYSVPEQRFERAVLGGARAERRDGRQGELSFACRPLVRVRVRLQRVQMVVVRRATSYFGIDGDRLPAAVGRFDDQVERNAVAELQRTIELRQDQTVVVGRELDVRARGQSDRLGDRAFRS